MAATIGLALIIGLDSVSASASDARLGAVAAPATTPVAGESTVAAGPIPRSVSTPIRLADAALVSATTQIREHRYRQAITSLETVRRQGWKAHEAGLAQIGLPPTDPESDDPPGPPSVLAVLRLEHRIGVELVPQFDGMTKRRVVSALRHTLWRTHRRRDVMLDAVIALPKEGDGADYADGMADSLGLYAQELRQLESATESYTLTRSGTIGVNSALARVRATKDKVDRAFGGGE